VFRDGHGVEQDVIEGAYWMDRAATQGWTDAQWALSQMYLKRGAPHSSLQQARRWMLAAARGGHAEAQLRLGIMLMEQGGSAQERSEGQRWLQQAALQGLQEAQQFLSRIEPLNNTGSRK
jgi:TPR repeat protein